MIELKPIIKFLTTWWLFPGSVLTVWLPSAFIILAPKHYADFVLNSANVPSPFNPWAGVAFLYFSSCLVLSIARKIWNVFWAWHLSQPLSDVDAWSKPAS